MRRAWTGGKETRVISWVGVKMSSVEVEMCSTEGEEEIGWVGAGPDWDWWLRRPERSELQSSDPSSSLRDLRNWLIGSRVNKEALLASNVLPRLVALVSSSDASTREEAAVCLSSLAKTAPDRLADAGAAAALLGGLREAGSGRCREASLKCLRCLFESEGEPAEQLYQDGGVIPSLLEAMTDSPAAQEAVCSILSRSCRVSGPRFSSFSQQGRVDSHGRAGDKARERSQKSYAQQVLVVTERRVGRER